MQAIEHLSRTEKLRMMEALWRDLAANAGELPSPAWHEDALKQAEAEVAGGSARLIDWEEAKQHLLQQARSKT